MPLLKIILAAFLMLAVPLACASVFLWLMAVARRLFVPATQERRLPRGDNGR